MGGAYKVKKLAARDSHFLLNKFLNKHFGVVVLVVWVVLVVVLVVLAVVCLAPVAVVACHYFYPS